MAKTLAIIGLGAFGQLMARHLQPHFQLLAHDPSPSVAAFAQAQSVPLVTLAEAARADYVVIATPVEKIAAAAALAPSQAGDAGAGCRLGQSLPRRNAAAD